MKETGCAGPPVLIVLWPRQLQQTVCFIRPRTSHISMRIYLAGQPRSPEGAASSMYPSDPGSISRVQWADSCSVEIDSCHYLPTHSYITPPPVTHPGHPAPGEVNPTGRQPGEELMRRQLSCQLSQQFGLWTKDCELRGTSRGPLTRLLVRKMPCVSRDVEGPEA